MSIISRKKIVFFIFIGLILCLAFTFFFIGGNSTRPTKYIALIAKISNQQNSEEKKSTTALAIEKALKFYLKQINESQEYPYKLELKVFDNCNDGGRNRWVYKNIIAKEDKYLLAIDFSWGKHLKKAYDVIRDSKVPVITINPDHNNLDFGGHALFVNNDDDVPLDLSSFVKNALHIDSLNFISEIDYPLHEVFKNCFDSLGIHLKTTIGFLGESVHNNLNYQPVFNQIDSLVASHKSKEKLTILFNTHNANGDTILKYIDNKYSNITVIGPVYFTKLTNDNDFGVDNGNEMIVINRPKEALSKRLYKDLQKLKKLHPTFFDGGLGPICVKRSFDAIALLKYSLGKIKNKKNPSKSDLIELFKKASSLEIVGEEDLYQFNTQNSVVKELVFSNMKNGKMISYTMQLNSKREVIPNLFFGMEIQDIFDLDVNSNSFSADFYYWIKVDTADKHVESYISFQNMKQSESTKELVIEEMKDNILYRLYRVSGKFFVEYDLRNYPHDEQEIDIIVEILRPIDDVKISFDKESFVQDTTLLERFKVPGWEKSQYFVTVNNMITKSMRGDPTHNNGELNKFKTFYFSLDVKRNWLSGFLEIILPLAMISFISIGLLFTKDISFMTLGEVSVGTFLGIIAFSISLSETTPSTSYLTKADLLFWLSFITNFISFMVVIVLNSRYDEIAVKRVNTNWIKYPLLILYPVLVTIILLF